MLKKFCYTGEKKLSLKDYPPDYKIDSDKKREFIEKMEANQLEIKALQDKLYAQRVEGIVVVLQALDAAGKDSTIKHTLAPINPQGIEITSFKQPSSREMAHDYLWRAHLAIPERGEIAVFNRSYYEDVLVVKIHELQENYKIAERCLFDDEKFFAKRYKQIRHFEEYLYDNSYRIVKIFLHVSKDEQKKRFLERIDDPNKNWKFSAADLKERAFFDDYMAAFQEAINETATKDSPWYILPADQKWYTRYLVSEIMLSVLKECKPQYPKLPPNSAALLKECKEKLLSE